MAYLQHCIFLDTDSTVTTSVPLTINSKAETMKLSVEGAGTLDVTIEGKIVPLAPDYYDIAAVKLADYTVVAKIEAAGLYAVDVQGLAQVRIVNGGSAGDVTVVGVVVGQ